MTPGRWAVLLVCAALACGAVAVLSPVVREAAVVAALFCCFLAGGVLNWDRRGGH
jgi:hypothetical protein